MKPKTEDLLYYLLWIFECATRPTLSNLMVSFDGWRDRSDFARHVSRLEQRKLLNAKAIASKGSIRPERVLRLTEKGRLHAVGGRDPEERWNRHWDRQWRLVAFDIPNARSALRTKLRREFRARGFGCIQRSVWVSPDPLQEVKGLLADIDVDAHSLIFWEGRPCAGESDHDIVTAAWDFPAINRGYTAYRQVLQQRPAGRFPANGFAPPIVRAWLAKERAAWLDAVARDPLLPGKLLPPGYLGREAWKARLDEFGRPQRKPR